MMNMNLINKVVEWIIKAYEFEGIHESEKTIAERTLNWYNHSDISDFETLAAAVWIGDYRKIDFDVIEAVRYMLFPTIPIEYSEIHSHEITNAYKDGGWW